ncbi:hypothetical protein [Thalassospira xiamenensis]|uniref:Uncharacterized protein n=1 Tax=Thalassospira xiamenensis TaxID=220697 RepID=A0A285U241_9PROT|nr:hypothetical protein [Thalassospira xiamenensis]SOC30967.1 hypothetical protein SAMN05428964_11137 [Thalassospira xiamenensis]
MTSTYADQVPEESQSFSSWQIFLTRTRLNALIREHASLEEELVAGSRSGGEAGLGVDAKDMRGFDLERVEGVINRNRMKRRHSALAKEISELLLRPSTVFPHIGSVCLIRPAPQYSAKRKTPASDDGIPAPDTICAVVGYRPVSDKPIEIIPLGNEFADKQGEIHSVQGVPPTFTVSIDDIEVLQPARLEDNECVKDHGFLATHKRRECHEDQTGDARGMIMAVQSHKQVLLFEQNPCSPDTSNKATAAIFVGKVASFDVLRQDFGYIGVGEKFPSEDTIAFGR